MLAALLALALAQAPPPEPGLVDPAAVAIPALDPPRREGDARAALDAWLAAHRAHLDDRLDEALAGYLAFLGHASHRELPERYRTMALERVEKLRVSLRLRYREACSLYRRDRAAGLRALADVARAAPGAPEAEAALAVIDSDALLRAIAAAEAGGPREALEAAIHVTPRALHRRRAKELLIEKGGPDLFAPGERDPAPEEEEPEEEDSEETTIEFSDE